MNPSDNSSCRLPNIPASLPGLNPLVRAAAPLLECARLFHAMQAPPDLQALRERLIDMVHTFSRDATATGMRKDTLESTHYCLCSFIDECIATTPWGRLRWAEHSLLVTFHQDASGGEYFFQKLRRLATHPADNIDVLELLFVLLALGMGGCYRTRPDGETQLLQLRMQLQQLIHAQRGAPRPTLPDAAPGQAMPHAAPSWRGRLLISTLTMLALSGLYLAFSTALRQDSQYALHALDRLRIPRHGVEQPYTQEPPTC
jgi:type VI secretion system protein ImpK